MDYSLTRLAKIFSPCLIMSGFGKGVGGVDTLTVGRLVIWCSLSGKQFGNTYIRKSKTL